MPWKVVKGSGKRPWKIVKSNTGEVVGSSASRGEAQASVKARYANEPAALPSPRQARKAAGAAGRQAKRKAIKTDLSGMEIFN